MPKGRQVRRCKESKKRRNKEQEAEKKGEEMSEKNRKIWKGGRRKTTNLRPDTGHLNAFIDFLQLLQPDAGTEF